MLGLHTDIFREEVYPSNGEEQTSSVREHLARAVPRSRQPGAAPWTMRSGAWFNICSMIRHGSGWKLTPGWHLFTSRKERRENGIRSEVQRTLAFLIVHPMISVNSHAVRKRIKE